MGSVTLPGNWQNFLKVDANKVELFIFLSQQFGDTFIESGKELVATLGEKVLAAPPRMDLSSIVRCKHEDEFSSTQHAQYNMVIGRKTPWIPT